MPPPYQIDYVCVDQSPQCVYWSESRAAWSDEGCTLLNFTRWNVTCGCTHLSDFASKAADTARAHTTTPPPPPQ